MAKTSKNQASVCTIKIPLEAGVMTPDMAAPVLRELCHYILYARCQTYVPYRDLCVMLEAMTAALQTVNANGRRSRRRNAIYLRLKKYVAAMDCVMNNLIGAVREGWSGPMIACFVLGPSIHRPKEVYIVRFCDPQGIPWKMGHEAASVPVPQWNENQLLQQSAIIRKVLLNLLSSAHSSVPEWGSDLAPTKLHVLLQSYRKADSMLIGQEIDGFSPNSFLVLNQRASAVQVTIDIICSEPPIRTPLSQEMPSKRFLVIARDNTPDSDTASLSHQLGESSLQEQGVLMWLQSKTIVKAMRQCKSHQQH